MQTRRGEREAVEKRKEIGGHGVTRSSWVVLILWVPPGGVPESPAGAHTVPLLSQLPSDELPLGSRELLTSEGEVDTIVCFFHPVFPLIPATKQKTKPYQFSLPPDPAYLELLGRHGPAGCFPVRQQAVRGERKGCSVTAPSERNCWLHELGQ